MNTQQVLIIDDEPDIRELLTITLTRMGLEIDSAANYKQACQLLAERSYHLCLTDMRLPDGNGLDLIDLIQNRYPHIPVAMITAHGNMEAAIRALKAGAFDFISKPIDLNNLRTLISSALKLGVNTQPNKSETPQGLLGNSQPMQQLRKTIAKLARNQAPVYIYGESGTGKELAARLIHQQGPRKDKAFVPVNCSAIPEELMESEFFGHKKGSFTGAHADKQGLFAAAHGGTLFLDEIADLPLNMQVKLLRAIQERSIRPLGETREQAVDVRILSASHKDLDERIAAETFRQDLYYRINVIRLDLPSLRQRREDIPLLTQHILEKVNTLNGDSIELSADAEQTLQAYDFPGNVRELENILERAAALCENRLITPSDLQLPSNPVSTPTATQRSQSLDIDLEQQERQSIQAALAQTRWNKTEAAKLLGISFRQLRYRIKKLNIE